MKTRFLFISVFALATVYCQGQDEEVTLDDVQSRGSYAIGYNFGTSVIGAGATVDEALTIRGLRDALGQESQLLSDEDLQQAFVEFRTAMQQAQAVKNEAARLENLEIAKEFFAQNATEEGVVTLPSGLQYKVIEEGSGESPSSADSVSATYAGRLLDGTEFDSGTATFAVTGVIRGWTEALQLMKPGAKWELFIPSELAYGASARGSIITPNSALIFDIELVSVVKAAPSPISITPSRQPVTSDIIKVPSREEMENGAEIEIIKKEDIEQEIERQRQQ